MSEITLDEKIKFWKIHFPKPTYRVYEIAEFLCCSEDTTMRWLKHYEVPSIKITGSPIICQENLINFLLRADADHFNDGNNIGVEFCLEDLKKRLGNRCK